MCIYRLNILKVHCKTMKTSRGLSLRPSGPRSTSLKFVSLKSRKSRRKIKGKIKQLRVEMAEISEDHRCIREGQRKVRERLEEIQSQRKKLWQETELIAKDSITIQMKLNFMFKIIKARAQNDYALVSQLTRSLRDLISKPNQ
ncbi:uncharacterized protein LOC119989767 isoform X3 [Tripterygium wilfordii]|uniref:uncharacterized protein LOC119989767 isoform X3 n=1 Tax=Tripterygium wilfordii TaxID=458696 RepID=UPI0018F82DEC|nr:uncharacterized protein LOC119989767 isoform X3 [Tripterygium wilfordii]